MGLSNTSLPQNEVLKKRYGEVNSPTEGPWNDIIGAILSHRSVRSYKTEKLPDFTLETLMAAAQSAATSSNMQVWSVVSTTDPDKKKELARMISGKIMEYLATEIPILSIGDPKSEAGKILSKASYTKMILRDSDKEIYLFLKKVIHNKGKLKNTFPNLDNWSRKNITYKLSNLLSDL